MTPSGQPSEDDPAETGWILWRPRRRRWVLALAVGLLLAWIAFLASMM